MKLHFIKHENGTVTTSTWPFEENNLQSFPFEVTEEQSKEVEEGISDWDIVDGEPVLKPSTRKADKEAAEKEAQEAATAAKKRKFELIQKVTSGTATPEEQEEFANLL